MKSSCCHSDTTPKPVEGLPVQIVFFLVRGCDIGSMFEISVLAKQTRKMGSIIIIRSSETDLDSRDLPAIFVICSNDGAPALQ